MASGELVGHVCSTAKGSLRFQNFLGRGGNGHVYEALLEDSQLVAVKVIKSVKKASDCQAFLLAHSIVRSYPHPNLAAIIDVNGTKKLFLILMEYLRGPDVLEVIIGMKSRMNKVGVALVIEGVLKALSHLHALNLVHCDVKLDNIKWRDENGGEVVLLDIDDCHYLSSADGDYVPNPPLPAPSFRNGNVYQSFFNMNTNVENHSSHSSN
eukprot:Filipodium_phascolosomae@DN5855_c0_g1_i1.p1